MKKEFLIKKIKTLLRTIIKIDKLLKAKSN